MAAALICAPLFFAQPWRAVSIVLVVSPLLSAIIVVAAYVEQQIRRKP
jgi:hypothetical protein